MSMADRQRWDGKYSAKNFNAPESHPSEILQTYHDCAGGTNAWDLACGAGRNTRYLLQMGYQVTALDISPVALERCRCIADNAGDRLQLLELDVDTWMPPDAKADLVCVTRFFQPRLIELVHTLLKPGGIFIYESFNERYAQRRPDMSPRFLLPLGYLRNISDGMEIIHLADGMPGQYYISRAVLRKPL